jgi:pimeloyl-ACP methyl ester carboxylesterase
MSTIADAGTSCEQPVFFDAENGHTLFGIFTRPTVTPLGVAVVVLAGGGFTGSTHRNRLAVHLCRRLASQGYHCLRFDWHGVGESTGSVRRFSLDEPFVDDLQSALAWVESQGIGRFLILGCCFGARTALQTAREISGIEGLVLVSLPVRNYGSAAEAGLGASILKALRPRVIWRLSDRQRRRRYLGIARMRLRRARSMLDRSRAHRQQPEVIVDPGVQRSFEEMIRRQVPLLLIYGEEDRYGEEFRRADALTDSLDATPNVQVRFLDGQVHTFHRVIAQDEVLRLVCEWAAGLTGRLSSPAARPYLE